MQNSPGCRWNLAMCGRKCVDIREWRIEDFGNPRRTWFWPAGERSSELGWLALQSMLCPLQMHVHGERVTEMSIQAGRR